ncbi:MAG: MFS transporter [Kiritimatiellia bacterium]
MSEKISMGIRVKLSAMMFLQFMMLPVWFMTLSGYAEKLGASSALIGWIVSTMAVGTVAAPIVGTIADRYFNAEKVLAVSNIICAVMLAVAANAASPVLLFVALQIAMMFYMPSWGLTANIAMANSSTEAFPQIRVFGSIGWVAASAFSIIGKQLGVTVDCASPMFYCGAGTALVAGALGFMLPATPPKAKGQPVSLIDTLGLRSITLMKKPSFAIFIVVSFLMMIPFSLYMSYGGEFLLKSGFKLPTLVMSIGQFGEIFFMLILAVAIKKLGIKRAMICGLSALTLRYAFFWIGGVQEIPALYYAAILLHGLIFGFFIIGGQMFIDKKAPDSMRSQAQGFFWLVTFGMGSFISNFANRALITKYELVIDEAKNLYSWNQLWLIALIFSAVLLVVFALLFKPHLDEETAQEA